ncbi:MAG: restriction endonuclease [Firmicutes bacterium]|nr:restriction endonuclease [Bacillota bacterium]
MTDLWKDLIPQDVKDLYEVHNFNHAAEVLTQGCPDEFKELMEALITFRTNTGEILKAGGNESDIPKSFSGFLRPKDWLETKIHGDLIIWMDATSKDGVQLKTEKQIKRFIDGHKIDFVKNRVAFDVEWNSKDQTFDRDLYAFRTFHECGIISAGVLVTRCEELNEIFTKLGVKNKYGASTTWMGKLLPRLESGRHGGCPVLAFGIKKKLVLDWKE